MGRPAPLQRAERQGLPGLRLMDLGDRLLVRPPSVTGLVDRMERLGHVIRNSSAHDLRGKEVRLTAAGRDLIHRVLQDHGIQIATVMGGLNMPAQKQLLLLLERLGAYLESIGEGNNRAAACRATDDDFSPNTLR